MAMIILPATAAVVSWIVARFVLPPLLSLDPGSRQSSPACEGYWPDAEVCLKLGPSRPSWFLRTSSNAGCPQWRINPGWVGRDELSTRLRDIEAVAKEWEKQLVGMDSDSIEKCEELVKPPVWIRRERGVAWSRIQEGVIAGNSEFHSDSRSEERGGHVCWTDALLPVYIDEFGVEPSDGFKDFVATFSLVDFHDRLAKLKSCSTSQ